jgi:hypothetical protein
MSVHKHPLDAGRILSLSKRVAAKTGIYFLINNDEIVYVGQSIDIDHRVAQHRLQGHRKFARWAWVPCLKSQLRALERTYLDYFLPAWNIDYKTKTGRAARPSEPKAENPPRVRESIDPPCLVALRQPLPPLTDEQIEQMRVTTQTLE